MALIVVLSVFNGFESVVNSLYSSFDPDVKITSTLGKSFNLAEFPNEKLKKIEGIAVVTEVLEENALLKYEKKQYIATLKGVSANFKKMTGIDTMIVEGNMVLERGNQNMAVLGYGIAYNLGVHLNSVNTPLSIYVPKRGKLSSADPANAFSIDYVMASGVFSVQQDFDTKYVLVPIRLVQTLVEKPNKVSAIELSIKSGTNVEEVQSKITKLLGPNFEVKNRLQLLDYLYKMMKYEKWAVFLILAFIMLLSIFNVIGSLTMLIIEKKKDIAILKSMGAPVKLIKQIFFYEGMMITFIGAVSGLFIGLLICIIQIKTGIIKLNPEATIGISAFPVHLELFDFGVVFLTVTIIGAFAAWFPVRRINKRYLDDSRSLIVR